MWADAKRIGRVAVPIYLSMLATTLAALIDPALLGRHGTTTLAAFAVSFGVFGPATAAVTGAVRGVMPFVAAAADDARRLAAVLRDGMCLALCVGLAGACAVAGVPVWARMSGIPDEVGSRFGALPLLLAGAVVVGSVGCLATFGLAALGQGRRVLHAGLAGAAATVLLSPALILGPGGLPALGLLGAGISIVVAAAVTAVGAVCGLRRYLAVGPVGMPTRRPVPRGDVGRRPDARQVVAMARVGVPTAGSVLMKFGTLGVLAMVAGRLGAVSVAAHTIADAVVRLTFTAAVAVGLSVVPLVAGPAGRGETLVVRRGVAAGVGVTLGVFIVLEAAIVLAHDLIFSAFTADPAVRALVEGLLPLVLVVVLLDGVQAVFGFALTALKRTMPSLVIFAVCYGALAALAVPISGRAGLTGVWVALAIANLFLVLGQGLAFRREHARPPVRSSR